MLYANGAPQRVRTWPSPNRNRIVSVLSQGFDAYVRPPVPHQAGCARHVHLTRTPHAGYPSAGMGAPPCPSAWLGVPSEVEERPALLRNLPA